MDLAQASSNASTPATQHHEQPRAVLDSSPNTISMGNRSSSKRPRSDSDGDESDDSLCSDVMVIKPVKVDRIVPGSRDREDSTKNSSTSKRQRVTTESEATTLDKSIATERITNCLDASAPVAHLFIGYDYCFEVSKHALIEVPYFRALFSGNWKPGPNRLFGDDPFAVRILLHILHHTPSQLPQSISTMQLSNLATLCDKYQVTDLVVPHVEFHNWISPLWENGKPRGKLQKWVWILKVFYRTPEQSPRLGVVLDMVAANMYKGNLTCIELPIYSATCLS